MRTFEFTYVNAEGRIRCEKANSVEELQLAKELLEQIEPSAVVIDARIVKVPMSVQEMEQRTWDITEAYQIHMAYMAEEGVIQ